MICAYNTRHFGNIVMDFRLPPKACLLLALIAFLYADEALARKWTDSTGRFSVEAEFVEFVGGQVALKKTDGELIRLPLERLSEADQQHVQSLTAPAAVSQPPSSGRKQTTAASPDTTPAQAGPPSSGDGATRTVVAEGVGLTPEEALKDAFRAAVRQVVGEVVDAETLIKDDQIVKDQILTYSDGFVPQHTKLSERSEAGLFRVTIRAVVERRKLEVRLRAANVSLRNVDGQSLFGNIVSQLENEKDGAALLRAALEGFPKNYLEADVVGEPTIVQKDDQKATLRFQVQLRPNVAAYKTFAERLKKTLHSIARDEGGLALTFRPDTIPDTPQSAHFALDDRYHPQRLNDLRRLMPKAFTVSGTRGEAKYRDNAFFIAVATEITGSGKQLQLSYYVIDATAQAAIAEAVFGNGWGRILVLNASGDTLFDDRFPMSEPQKKVSSAYAVDYHCFPVARLGTKGSGPDGDRTHLYGADEKDSFVAVRRSSIRIFLFAPVFFGAREIFGLVQKPLLTISRDITLSLPDIKSIDKVKCEIEFD